MADYDDIRAFFDRSDELQTVARKAAEIPIVSGFVLDVDYDWAFEFDRFNGLLSDSDARQIQYDNDARYSLDGRYFPDGRPFPGRRFFLNRAVGYRRRNLNSKVPAWDSGADWYKGVYGKKLLPVVLSIIHRPLRGGKNAEEDVSSLRRLVDVAQEAGVAVRIEERPRARLAFASGDEISTGPGKAGTLGGVLKDTQGGTLYGMTCAHVAKKNDVVHDSAGNQIGTCIADTVRAPLTASLVCDPVNLALPNPIPGNGPDVNMLDCGLVKLGVTVTQASVAGVAPALSAGQCVRLQGASTHSTTHWLGSLCLSYGFADGGQNFCFRDSIELVPRPSGIFGSATVPTQGDSGGWVLTDDNPPDWVGVFFGEDGKRGFLIRARWAHDWAQKVTGANLVL